MTVREIFKKVDAYNEVAEIMGTDKAIVKVAGFSFSCLDEFENFKDFRAYLKREIIDTLANAVLACDEFENDKPVTITYTDIFGDAYSTNIEVGIYAA